MRDDGYSDRAVGAFMGLAVGDALGSTLEFTERDSAPLHREMTGGGPFALPPGAWTDDTSMALCLADTLIARRRVNRFDFASRLTAWATSAEYSSTGTCFDIGFTTAEALSAFATDRVIIGGTSPNSAGNGSLVRCAPIAMVYARDSWRTRDMAAWQSSVTHAHPDCLSACGYLALALADAIKGGERDQVLIQSGPWTAARVQHLAAGEWRDKARSEIRSTGYVVDTLEAALWAVHHTSSFEEALVLAVNLAGDADSIGAVTGQLAGAIYGLSAIPERWLNALARKEHLLQISYELAGTILA